MTIFHTCQTCGEAFVRTSRSNRVCASCANKVNNSPRQRKTAPKRIHISVNDANGKFAGFVSVASRKEIASIKLKKGYKLFGDPIV